MIRMLRPFVLVGVVAMSVVGLSASAGAAIKNSPTVRNCALLGGIDPDFVKLLGVSVTTSGGLVATGSSVQVLASESPMRADQMQHSKLTVTVTGPGATQTLSGAGVGHVTLDVNVAAAGTYTISWKAVFDNGFHSCPNGFTPMNTKPRPFVVQVP